MEPYVKLEDELALFNKEELIAHIRWLYRYLEEVKKQLRDARVRV